MPNSIEKATFAGGCFWCIEAIFKELKGVRSVTSGYTGGSLANPTYQEVCRGNTGHAEAIQIEYYPDEISYEDLLDVFWYVHDPTTLNRQGADSGTQYRSAIFYHNENQRAAAEESKKKLDAEHHYNDPVVTEIIQLDKFYPAENYHQNFYKNNPDQMYCRVVIDPKIAKFRKEFLDKLSINKADNPSKQ